MVKCITLLYSIPERKIVFKFHDARAHGKWGINYYYIAHDRNDIPF